MEANEKIRGYPILSNAVPGIGFLLEGVDLVFKLFERSVFVAMAWMAFEKTRSLVLLLIAVVLALGAAASPAFLAGDALTDRLGKFLIVEKRLAGKGKIVTIIFVIISMSIVWAISYSICAFVTELWGTLAKSGTCG